MKSFLTIGIIFAVFLQIVTSNDHDRIKRLSLPTGSSDNPVFNVTPILNAIKTALDTALQILSNTASLITGSTQAFVDQLRSLRDSVFNTITSQSQQIIDNLNKIRDSAHTTIETVLQNAENQLLSIEKDAEKFANCLSTNLPDTRSAIQDAATTGYNCVADKINDGIARFNNFIQNFVNQGITGFNLLDELNKCNSIQTGFIDLPGFINRVNCLINIGTRASSDVTQFFSTIAKGIVDTASFLNSIPGSTAKCATNVANQVSSLVQQVVDQVAKCKGGN